MLPIHLYFMFEVDKLDQDLSKHAFQMPTVTFKNIGKFFERN